MNILILSVGTRNKIVQYFVKTLNGTGKVIATDMSNLAPAIYDADKFYLVPRIDCENYIDTLIEICKKEKIDCMFALIDPELSLIAKNKKKFLEIGVVPLISDYDAVELAFNKYEMYKYLSNKNIKTPKTYISKEEFYSDLKKAKTNLNKAIMLKSDIPEFHYNLAYIYKQLGKEKLAKTYLDNYNKLTPSL